MGIESLTHSEDGTEAIPATAQDWQDWVSPTATRNHALDDPLLDWLKLYGSANGFQRDDELPGYDPRTDFGQFIMRKGLQFEAAVAAHLGTLIPLYTVASTAERSRDLAAAEETFEAMRRGEHGIYQAVLRDAETRTHGSADLLIRSDELHRLFPDSITEEEAAIQATDLGNQPWHYRVIDIKYTTLHFLAGGELSDSGGSAWAYMIQVYTYNRALGRLQGYLPPFSYLLGRGWQQTTKGITERGTSCMNRLGAVSQDYTSRPKGLLAEAADQACAWIRRVRTEGATWQILPEPSVPELRPNMGSTDQPWHSAKQLIGHQLEELTLLWNVGLKGRQAGNKAGVFRWTDPDCTPQVVEVTRGRKAPTLQTILEINQSLDGPSIRPYHVHAAEDVWRQEPPLEFYVDFETVNDLDDDFSRIPEKGGQPLIFMIGCGHVKDGQWLWSCFTAEALTEPAEAMILDSWLSHMSEVKRSIDPNGQEPLVFHWSHAEKSTFESAYNSAKERHPEKNWPTPQWFNFLKTVVRKEPVVVRGAFGFGLKALAKAMHAHGHIQTDWGAGPTDGMEAMVGAWSCAAEVSERGCTLSETELTQEIIRYNEVDCKVMMEILSYLRKNH